MCCVCVRKALYCNEHERYSYFKEIKYPQFIFKRTLALNTTKTKTPSQSSNPERLQLATQTKTN